MGDRATSAPLRVDADGGPGSRSGEPVGCGVPWPRGALRDCRELRLLDARGVPVPLQARALDLWPDGSVRWALVDWRADVREGTAEFRLEAGGAPSAPPPDRAISIAETAGGIRVDTGGARFDLAREAPLPRGAALRIEDGAGRLHDARVRELVVEERGPLRSCIRVAGSVVDRQREALLLEWGARLHFFAGSATVRFALTLRNPRRARHAGGFWELGDPGSIYLREASVIVPAVGGALRGSIAREAPWEELGCPCAIYQDSSGGENWRSRNHVNRRGVVPLSFRGYRLRDGARERTGLRATPILARGGVAVATRRFWENFPKSIEATASEIILGLFPRAFGDVHEIQGGEQKTHEFVVAFEPDPVTPDEPLAWARMPLLARASPAWYCASGAVPFLTPREADPHADYLRLVDAAIEGDSNFFAKRERIDEYGWRNFGDIYADHEAVFKRPDEPPLVSHYNNQYDAIGGFAVQFLRSGDRRWWTLMDDLAIHVADIDIYHTDEDRAAFNHGLFWHTFHYRDADRSTHRTYPRSAAPASGGPSSEHDYAAGLALHHFLTGSALSRESALELAGWVVAMDDGARTPFRWIAPGPTGLASRTRTPDYHGPGRGAANSVITLLAALRLTGERRYLEKAEELIRRCVHPRDDVENLALLDVERRWSYVVFLQALGVYLAEKVERGEKDEMHAYARAALLRYARWMAERERPYLDRPEILEYPTETWPAQDVRKSEVFDHAAFQATSEEERARFRERAEFFFESSIRTLGRMPTRALARPIVLLLSNGWLRSWAATGRAGPIFPLQEVDLPPTVFEDQRSVVLRRLRIAAAGFIVALAGAAILWWSA